MGIKSTRHGTVTLKFNSLMQVSRGSRAMSTQNQVPALKKLISSAPPAPR
jgi:hypothetical protein